MKKVIAIFSICTMVLFLQSCGGDSGLSLSVTSPTDGQVFSPGDSIPIIGSASDDVAISSIRITISKLGIDETIPGMSNQSENFQFTVNLDTQTPPEDDIEIVVTAFDGKGNTEEVKRKINIR